MGKTVRGVIGVLLLIAGLARCGAPTASLSTAQQECERSGGTWRGEACERARPAY